MQIFHIETTSNEIEQFLQNHGYDQMNEFQKKALINEWFTLNTDPGGYDYRENTEFWFKSIKALLEGVAYFQKQPITWYILNKMECMFCAPSRIPMLETDSSVFYNGYIKAVYQGEKADFPKLAHDILEMFDNFSKEPDNPQEESSKKIGPKK